jgi:hypothetical protein
LHGEERRPGDGATIRVITEVKTPEFWRSWDGFVRSFGSNPFYLGGFVSHYMRQCRHGGWTPQLILMTEGGRTVGCVALKTRGMFGVKTATQLLPGVDGTDFVADPAHLEGLVLATLKVVFDRLRCQFLDLTLPSESPSLELLRLSGGEIGLKLDNPPLKWHHKEHTVLRVQGTWGDFCKARGSNFVRHFKKIENRMSKEGEWKVERLVADGPEVMAKVHTVERNSWKEGWRKERGIKEDTDLDAFLEFWQESTDPNDVPRVWLLTLNGEPIAHEISLKLNDVVFLCKTSYDDRYAKLCPGVYITNIAIADLYDPGKVSTIDFMTPLPYLIRWTSLRLRRTRVYFSRTVPFITPLVTTVARNSFAMNTYKSLRRAYPRQS